MAEAIALIIFHDHRDAQVKRNIKRLPGEVMERVPGIKIQVQRRLRLLFGQRPYHALLRLQAKDTDTIVRALEDMEEHFSHIDGFM